ncbi:RNA polymerase subunit sigma-70 [Nocardia jejuensis]|uniref:RNA polymerase subunit sigma-70 n=1 Tax=Nocardia jejuensis TaxID=328049 RepID=UPI00082F9553|nr:RNA polymerase subunit sigma-70 [Nocardia jejuensis]
MTEALAAARAGDERAFGELVDPYRRELQLHCYRLLGSVHDAEDVLQETLVAAWRGLADFEQRSSVRTWLYRIATNRCLNAQRDARRRPVRPLPFDVPDPMRVGVVNWLEPYPDSLLDPEQLYQSRESVELAFITALQQLPPRQTAVLVLRDVLGFAGIEVADMLGTSTTAVKAALQRARDTLEAGRARTAPPDPGSDIERELTRRFAGAYAARDVDAVVALLTDDAWLTMPPWPHEYQGHTAIAAFLRCVPAFRDRNPMRLRTTRANGGPAIAVYAQYAGESEFRATGLLALTAEGDRIGALTHFPPSECFPRLELPLVVSGG